VISIRREIDESEMMATSFAALLKAFLRLTTAVPKTALAANPQLAEQCKQSLEAVAASLRDLPRIRVIDEAGEVAAQQIEQICGANKAAIEERDAAVKDVVAMTAKAIGGLKGDGERHTSHLSTLADGFEALSRVEDVGELRRRLRDDVGALRQSVEQMHQHNEEAIRQFESQVSDFEERLETARKDSGVDRLTGLPSQRDVERHLERMASCEQTMCAVLFDIEGFRGINEKHGTLFGDQLLQALAHLLRTKFPEEGTLFRWAADEFLAIAPGLPPAVSGLCRDIVWSFACSQYFTVKDGVEVPLTAGVAFGVAQYVPGESVEPLYRRVHDALAKNKAGARR
jgi:diguanylate cyclase (GGDEF)-like protein